MRFACVVNADISNVIGAMRKILAVHDSYTLRHCDNVAVLAGKFAQYLGLPEDACANIYCAGQIHDYGKVFISKEILNKPAPLTNSEFEEIKKHALLAAEALCLTASASPIQGAVSAHHERWDGCGYPEGLAGAKIALEARILSIADAFDAMTSDRPYRKAFTTEAALLELSRLAGAQFDPVLVPEFILMIREKVKHMQKKAEQMFRAVYENSPVGLVIVNSDTTIRGVNRYMFDAFRLPPGDIEGLRFGNVFHCHAVGKDGLCGETEYCENCALRGGVTAVLREGITIQDTVMDHVFQIHEVNQKKWFKISAARISHEDDEFAIVSFADITTQKEFEALLNYQLTFDMATGVTNKYTLVNTLKNLCLECDNLSIAMIDFDDFKKINDTYGHVAGDEVLQIFCKSALGSVRHQDIIGRFGGEEFMLVFPNASAGLLVKVLVRISQTTRLACAEELGISPTFSAGILELSGEQLRRMEVEAVIAAVDDNLYQAKARGKNMIFTGGVSILLKD